MLTQLALAAALVAGAPALKEREPLGTGPGYLGIMFQKGPGGLLVTEVKEDGPAIKAGLKEGDVITKLDDADMSNAETTELVQRVGNMRPGTRIELVIRRGGETRTLKIRLGARPADFPQQTPVPVPEPFDN